ncbi:integral membrane protein [Streptomyces xiamenensis]|uniref:Integral membrane protein n=1 Tax=Streptomyces xiamenensis TaxID=408015 RepID=A0A0F7G0E4_9ACTN|nr:hemolysin family protein [Streptomyces xiamenensis]AKG46695.1 integral membrane protein [Streptomyces xiamenensis]
MIALQLLTGLLMIALNAFFVFGEFCLISVRRSQIDPLAAQGDARARRVLVALEHLSLLMATAQLGITLTTLVLGIVAEPAIAHLLEPLLHGIGVPQGATHPIAFVVALSVATYLHMLLGEMVPKNIALATPLRCALLLGPPLLALSRALSPLVRGINDLASAVLRLLRVTPRDEVVAVFSDEELDRIVTDSGAAGLLDERATGRLRDALRLARRPVGEVMRPRGAVVTARVGISPHELEALSARTGFSRFPVLDERGAVLGYLHVKDALNAARPQLPFTLSALRPIARVGAGTPLDEVLTAMRGGATHLAAVMGADGRPTGVVTMEDVLRELVGPPGGTASAAPSR